MSWCGTSCPSCCCSCCHCSPPRASGTWPHSLRGAGGGLGQVRQCVEFGVGGYLRCYRQPRRHLFAVATVAMRCRWLCTLTAACVEWRGVLQLLGQKGGQHAVSAVHRQHTHAVAAPVCRVRQRAQNPLPCAAVRPPVLLLLPQVRAGLPLRLICEPRGGRAGREFWSPFALTWLCVLLCRARCMDDWRFKCMHPSCNARVSSMHRALAPHSHSSAQSSGKET